MASERRVSFPNIMNLLMVIDRDHEAGVLKRLG